MTEMSQLKKEFLNLVPLSYICHAEYTCSCDASQWAMGNCVASSWCMLIKSAFCCYYVSPGCCMAF